MAPRGCGDDWVNRRPRLSSLSAATQRFLDDAGCTVPVIKGTDVSRELNPELVAAVSAAGGLGVVQPISLTHLYGHDFREGLQLIKRLTDKPFGVNFTILENKKYKKQMDEWMHISGRRRRKVLPHVARQAGPHRRVR